MDDPNYDPNYITRDKCDSCGRHGVGAMFHHYGTPVMFLCTSCCATTVIERLVRRDIDAWLNEPHMVVLECEFHPDDCLPLFELGWTGTEVR